MGKMKKPEIRLIEDIEIKVKKRSVRDRIALKFRLANLLGVSVVELLGMLFQEYRLTGSIDIGKLAKNVDEEKLVNVIGGLLTRLTPDKADKIIMDLLDGVWANDLPLVENNEENEDVFENLFDENIALMYKILGFVLEVQLKTFFFKGSITDALKQAEVEKQKGSDNREQSLNQSGKEAKTN